MPIILRVAVKPTPALGTKSETVNLSTLKTEKLEVENSSEACIIPRVVPCVEAAVNIALLSHMMDYPHFN